MKKITTFVFAGILAIMAGCASAPVMMPQTVGPVPGSADGGETDGQLVVFSAIERVHDLGFQTAYYQRTPYLICDSIGREIKNVNGNNTSEFFPEPRSISLPPGKYQVKATANVGLGERIMVPVLVQAGRTTEVHLNGQWQPPSDVARNLIVFAPAGFAVGWRAPSL